MIGVRAEWVSVHVQHVVHVCFLLLGLFRCSSIILCLLSIGGESSLLDCWVLFCFLILCFGCSRLYVCYKLSSGFESLVCKLESMSSHTKFHLFSTTVFFVLKWRQIIEKMVLNMVWNGTQYVTKWYLMLFLQIWLQVVCIQGYYTVLISEICPYFAVLRLENITVLICKKRLHLWLASLFFLIFCSINIFKWVISDTRTDHFHPIENIF